MRWYDSNSAFMLPVWCVFSAVDIDVIEVPLSIPSVDRHHLPLLHLPPNTPHSTSAIDLVTCFVPRFAEQERLPVFSLLMAFYMLIASIVMVLDPYFDRDTILPRLEIILKGSLLA